ncbi:hypothetical protein GCM10009817_12450 [Terrabacter lapilli]|uniref:Uncharacterized protein n=1 Tax=Terrabacter lapilli TaxID=436231 RepID=A0ABP5D7D9_9MICO
MMIATAGPRDDREEHRDRARGSARTMGMNANRNTRMPMAKAKDILRMAAPTEMPMASTRATIIVARTNADR